MSEPPAVAQQRERSRPAVRPGELYAPLGWVLVRAPSLPVDAYLALGADPAAAKAAPALADPLVRTALAVGSPDLLEQLERGDGAPPADGRIAAKLLRYLIRMSTRPTPFGLFAGVGLASLSESTDLRLTPSAPRTRMRPDMAWLLAFVAELEARPEIRRELRVLTNPGAWVHGGRAFIAERSAVDGSGASGQVDIRATGAVQRALSRARAPIAWRDLAAELLTTPSATEEKVDGLLTELWQQTFLLTELRPPLTRRSPARYVARQLAGIPAAAAEHAALGDLLDAMSAWDEREVAERPAALWALTRKAAATVAAHDGLHVQVDAALPLAGTRITDAIAHAAARAAELLLRVNPGSAASRLEAYRRAFLDRYGSDREIGLLELLDPELGLGPPADVALPWADPEAARLAQRNATLRQLAVQALLDGRLAVELDGPTLSKLGPAGAPPATAPVSVDLAVFVLARSAADVDAGDFRLVIAPNVGAQAAGRNLGRFADLLGDPAVKALSEVAAAEIEHAPAELHAELVYLPHRGRTANVAIRPAVYRHEVVVTTMPGVDSRRAIPLSELVVGLRDDRFYVRWPHAPGDLHVHAGHMLTSRWAPPACRFLEECAFGGRMPLNPFQWGPAGDLPFLPRIEIDNIVLSPAQWQIDVAQRDATLPPDSEQFGAMLNRWRSDWMVCRRVYLTAGDNRLLLDLDEPTQVEQLREELRRLEGDRVVILQEPLPGPEHAWLEGPQGHHLVELVVPLAQRVTAPAGAELRRPASAPPAAIDRLRPPGSDWLYAKLYCPGNRQDELLAGPVRSLAELTMASGMAERWFFLRYADPEPHLRMRFSGNPEQLVTGLFPRVCAWAQELLAQGQCSRVSFDTYEREVERYGGSAAIGSAEEIFAVDSATAVEMLHRARSGDVELDRTSLAVLSVDELLAGLGLDVARRRALYRDAVAARHETGDDYRRRQQDLRRVLGYPRTAEQDPRGPLAPVLRARQAALAGPAERLRSLSAAGELTKPFEHICRSIVHMHCNRLLVGGEPPTEQHVLGLLLRTREGLERAPISR